MPYLLDDSTIRVPLPPDMLTRWNVARPACNYHDDDYKMALVNGWAYYDLTIRHPRQYCMVVYPVHDIYRSFDWSVKTAQGVRSNKGKM
jgi:hypothetical protein